MLHNIKKKTVTGKNGNTFQIKKYINIFKQMVSNIEFYFEKISKFLVGSYLNGVRELNNLSRTSKEMRIIFRRKKFVRLILNRNLQSLLLPFGIQTQVLNAFLQSSEGIISGSMVLQAYLGVQWETSDLDIYLPYLGDSKARKDNLQKFRAHFNKFKEVKQKQSVKKNRLKKYSTTYVSYIGDIKEFLDFQKLRDTNTSKCIQLIYVSKRLLGSVENIVRTFDLSIVANFYNGTRWNFDHYRHILKRRMQFLPQQLFSKKLGRPNLRRIVKYTKRGFRFKKTTRPEHISDGLWTMLDAIYK